jgi:hypothetical protein
MASTSIKLGISRRPFSGILNGHVTIQTGNLQVFCSSNQSQKIAGYLQVICSMIGQVNESHELGGGDNIVEKARWGSREHRATLKLSY